MTAPHPLLPADGLAWHISSHSGSSSACVAAALLPDGEVTVCNSNRPADGRVTFTPIEWNAFLAGVRDGEFDITFLAGLAS